MWTVWLLSTWCVTKGRKRLAIMMDTECCAPLVSPRRCTRASPAPCCSPVWAEAFWGSVPGAGDWRRSLIRRGRQVLLQKQKMILRTKAAWVMTGEFTQAEEQHQDCRFTWNTWKRVPEQTECKRRGLTAGPNTCVGVRDLPCTHPKTCFKSLNSNQNLLHFGTSKLTLTQPLQWGWNFSWQFNTFLAPADLIIEQGIRHEISTWLHPFCEAEHPTPANSSANARCVI